ncbi:MAG: GAF domain-containing protein, partial [Candidatus Eremiobacterota bacterium]
MNRGWFVASADLRILEWSEDLSRSLRIPTEAAVGRCCREVLPACGRRKVCPALEMRSPSPECPCLGIPLPTGQVLIGYADDPSGDAGLTLDLAATVRLASWLAGEDLDRGLELALETLSQALGADAAELFLASPVDGEMVLAAHTGWRRAAFCERTRFLPGEGFPGLVASQGKVLTTCRVGDDPRFLRQALKRHGIRSYACVPLLGEGRVLGSVNVAWRSSEAPLDRAARLLHWASLFLARALLASYDRTRLAVARTLVASSGNLEPVL